MRDCRVEESSKYESNTRIFSNTAKRSKMKIKMPFTRVEA